MPNDFATRQAGVAVKGINNKARVIARRAYGLESAGRVWARLIPDLNRASEAIGWSMEPIRRMARGPEALFDRLALNNGRAAKCL
jgi:hypothetical protein